MSFHIAFVHGVHGTDEVPSAETMEEIGTSRRHGDRELWVDGLVCENEPHLNCGVSVSLGAVGTGFRQSLVSDLGNGF